MRRITILLLCVTFGLQLNAQKLARVVLDGKYGFINQKGELAIENKFEKTGEFSGDYAAFLKNEKWGYINRKGDVVIEPQFDKVKGFDGGVAIALKSDKWRYIDAAGKDIEGFPETDKLYDFNNKRAIIRRGEKVGVIDPKGNIVVPVEYDEIKPFKSGFAKARKGEKWGFIDDSGNKVVNFEYDDLGSYKNGYTWGFKDDEGQWGVITNNSFKVLKDVEKIWDFNDKGITYAKQGRSIGFINKNGEWIVEPEYKEVRPFKSGLAPVYYKRDWGYINLNGEMVIEAKYKDAESFSEGGLAPVTDSGEWGFINTKGELEIPMKYGITAVGFGSFGFGSSEPDPKGFVDGLARVKTDKGWTYLKENGDVLGGQWYENVEPFK